MARARSDIRQHVTDCILAELEKGTPPWQKPWTGSAGAPGLPLRQCGTPYRGINVLMLWVAAEARGYGSPYWMTFKQARTLGGAVRKGERASRSVFYGTIERGDDEGCEAVIRFLKTNAVFNAAQIEGLPEEYAGQVEKPVDLGTQHVPHLDAAFASLGVPIDTTPLPRAYYDNSRDRIHMPPIETFVSAAKYYGTLGHEASHAVGHNTRLDRFSAEDGAKDYAVEEMIAEISSAILGASLGVEPDFTQNAAYIGQWARAMAADNRVIFKAAAEAQRAADYILEAMDVSRKQAA